MLTDKTVKPDESKDEGKKQATEIRHKDAAMAVLTIVLRGHQQFCVMKAQTAEWPGGKAHLVVKALKDRFEKKDTAVLVQ